MKRIITVILLIVAALLFTGPASGHGGTTGKYPAPHDLDITNVTCDSADLEFDEPAHANFFVVKISSSSDFSNPVYIRPKDQSIGDAVNDNHYTLTGLNDNDRLYVKAKVADWEGHGVSVYSTAKSFRTDTC